MARPTEGFKTSPDPRTEIIYVRFTHKQRRYNLSTGTRDSIEAQEEAARLYSAVVSGQWQPGVVGVRPGTPLDEVAAEWLADLEGSLDPETITTYGIYVTAHWMPFFSSIDQINSQTGAAYRDYRLLHVKARTVRKELSALRSLISWCKRKNYLSEKPVIESPPSKAVGTPDRKRPHKTKPIELDEKVAEAIIDALPEFSKGGPTSAPFPIKARVRVAWETGLRPATLDEICVPEHYQKGAEFLIITDEIDKARYGRDVPLTEPARNALDSILPNEGLIFGRHDYRRYLKQAARDAGLPEHIAKQVSPYDFRHARGTFLTETSGNLPGVAYLLGHLKTTTTDIYVHPSKRAAKDALAAASKKTKNQDSGRILAAPRETCTSSKGSCLSHTNAKKPADPKTCGQCEDRDLNPDSHNGHWNLNPARLPVPPPSRGSEWLPRNIGWGQEIARVWRDPAPVNDEGSGMPSPRFAADARHGTV